MHTYISLVGKDHHLVLNSLWAVLKEELYKPDKIILLHDDERCDELERDMDNLLKAYDIEADFEHADLEDNIPVSDDENVLDISGGDNVSLSRLLIKNNIDPFKHIFVLKFDEDIDHATPYPLMNHSKIKVIDILEKEVR